MIMKIIPYVVVLLGLMGGTVAGYVAGEKNIAGLPGLMTMADCPVSDHATADATANGLPGILGLGGREPEEEVKPPVEFVELSAQFIVPVVIENDVASMVIMSLSLEVDEGKRSEIMALEPKLRDAFLQVMFQHANVGGFEGNFLNNSGLGALRRNLLEAGISTVGPAVHDVLIVDMVKQAI